MSGLRAYPIELTLLSAQKALASSNPASVQDHKHISITVSVTGQASGDILTVKFPGSSQVAAPDFGSAKTGDNSWEYIDGIRAPTGNSIPGGTGAVFDFDAGSGNQTRIYQVNFDTLRWFGVELSANSDTTNAAVTVKINLFTNE